MYCHQHPGRGGNESPSSDSCGAVWITRAWILAPNRTQHVMSATEQLRDPRLLSSTQRQNFDRPWSIRAGSTSSFMKLPATEKTSWRPLHVPCMAQTPNTWYVSTKTFRGTAVLPVRASASHNLVKAPRSRVWSAAGRHSTNKQAYPGHHHRRHPTKHHAHGQWPRKWASEALASPGC